MDELLTSRQLQDLLQVDRITIYRMLNDGRLRGFKVGGQWRFSRQEIERWLQGQRTEVEAYDDALLAEGRPAEGRLVPSAQLLPLPCILAIQSVYAEALDVAAVTVDLDGTLLTDVSNSSEFCNLILSTAEGRRRCTQVWIGANGSRFQTCHAGLLCLGARIVVSDRDVAVTSSCQFVTQTPDGDELWLAGLPALAAGLDLAESELAALSTSVRRLPERALQRIPGLLQRVVQTFAEIGQERLTLLSRLQRIAEMSKI